MSKSNGKSFLKSFGLIMGTHIVLSLIPLIFLPVLNSGLNTTLKPARGAGEITILSIYFILFAAAYFLVGRVAGGSAQYERVKTGSILGRAVSSVLIGVLGLVVLFCVQVPGNMDAAGMVVFSLPQLMARRAIVEGIIGNVIFAAVMMVMPAVLIWIGFFSNGFDFKKKKRSGKK